MHSIAKSREKMLALRKAIIKLRNRDLKKSMATLRF